MDIRTSVWVEDENEGREYRVWFLISPGEAAKTYGLPENCHPGSDPEVMEVTVESDDKKPVLIADGFDEVESFLAKIDNDYELVLERAICEYEPDYPEYERES